VPVVEFWATDDGGAVPAEAVPETLRKRIDRGQLETWLTSSSGRSLAFVTNTERALVMLLTGESDPGEHAVDLGAQGASDGFVLANGQQDEHPDEDTMPIDEAFRIVEHLVREGTWPADVRWISDR
jgi:hypothetical protein